MRVAPASFEHANASPVAQSGDISGDAAANVVLGLRAASSRNYAHAIELYSRAIDTASLGRNDLAVAHHARAAALAATGAHDRALQDQAYAIALCPDAPRYRHDRARLLLEIGQPALAVEDFTAAAQLRGDDAAHWGWRGMAQLALGRYADALRDLSQAIALPGQPAFYLAMRGLTYTMLSRFDEAGVDFQRAERGLPTAWGAYANGVLYERVGLAQMALDLYEEAQMRAADGDEWLRIEATLAPYRMAAARLAAAERQGREPIRRVSDGLSDVVLPISSQQPQLVGAHTSTDSASDGSIDVPEPGHAVAAERPGSISASLPEPVASGMPARETPAALTPDAPRLDIVREIEAAWQDASHPTRRRKRRRRKSASSEPEAAATIAEAEKVVPPPTGQMPAGPEAVDQAIAAIRAAVHAASRRPAGAESTESPYQLGMHEMVLDAETTPPDRTSRAASFVSGVRSDDGVLKLGLEHLAADDARQLGEAAALVREIYLLTPAELVPDPSSASDAPQASRSRNELRADRR